MIRWLRESRFRGIVLITLAVHIYLVMMWGSSPSYGPTALSVQSYPFRGVIPEVRSGAMKCPKREA
jgi:hypothetical protein